MNRLPKTVAIPLASCLLGLVATAAPAADARRAPFGALADGTQIEMAELKNAAGMTARIITLGAAVQALFVPDRDGKSEDVVLGYAGAQEYLDKPQYFGATVGRFANRIANGRFTLDGHDYRLADNDHGNSLHGGRRGFDKVVWHIDTVQSGPTASVTLSYLSPAGEEGYPGNLHVEALYTLNERNEFGVQYRATTDAPTIVNISNHSYFNLSGAASGRSVMDELLQIDAARYTVVDEHLIPTGEQRAVAGTPFDFREPTAIGLRIRDGRDAQIRYGRGYDHNFVVSGAAGRRRTAVRVADPHSGRVMEIQSAAPGVQFYSGNFFDGTIVGKGGVVYRQGDAIVLEPQLFPDAPNHADFPSARLAPGDTYENTIVYRFTVQKRKP
ncbi:MAG: aldose epimerase family protein [Gammaproteobacteria bacterium]